MQLGVAGDHLESPDPYKRVNTMRASWLFLLCFLPPTALAQALSPEQKAYRAIFQELVEIDTTDSKGDCTAAANAMAVHLRSAGFAADDVQVLVPAGAPRKGNLVARLRGTGAKKPLLLLAHIDVVEARREDWEREPFKLVEEDGMFYGRGVSDDKSRAASYVANMVRYKRERFVPNRDIHMALTCDEEVLGKYNGVVFLMREHRAWVDADLVISEGGGGSLDRSGKPVRFGLQAGEKIPQNYVLEVTNPGGHSAAPTRANAIYELAEALGRLSRHEFPFRLIDTTREYFERRGRIEQGAVAEDMRAILRDPPPPEVLKRFANGPFLNATVRTTCVATMLEGGHAFNALPQRAKATVNCRILPGETAEEVRDGILRAVGNERVKVTMTEGAIKSPVPPLNRELLATVEALVEEMWPGVPVVPTLTLGATDGRFLNSEGIWTYGITGLFHRPEGSFAHGLNERAPVKSVYDACEFQYRLAKRLSS
jgi:acetylornithine deacetylase/succinyl-diaminopimelate desuccinylase-like protein